MPILKFKHLLSFSSEDSRHPASNMLKPETYYKWKCASGSERQASILLQLEKSSQINAVDIGNNGSAFIEVLVGRSTWSPSEEFKVLLVASSFMSPVEGKAGKDISRVRMFGLQHLTKTVVEEKWDQIKVVCTQPYNQSEGYGLSFIKLSSPHVENEGNKKVIQLGHFKLRSSSDDEEDVSSGSFFQKRMNIPVVKNIPKSSMAAAAREASHTPISNAIFKTRGESSSKSILLSNDRRQEVASALLQGSPSVKTHVTKSIPKTEMHSSEATTPKRKKEVESTEIEKPSKKIKAEAPPKPNKLKTGINKSQNVSYGKILGDVTFALSGYQNPERGNIRDMGMEMGAKYEASWNHKCSHLICAFANTPKFQQVKGKGKIVKKSWFDECSKKKKRMNTKEHRLDGGGDSSFESSCDEDMTSSLVASTVHRNKIDAMESPPPRKSSSECDTEDELEKIRALSSKSSFNSNNKAEKVGVSTKSSECKEDLQGDTTEDEQIEELPPTTNANVSTSGACATKPELPDFFERKTFFLYGDFETRDRRLLTRYITAYSGTIADYMSDSINFVISLNCWDKNFDQAYADNKSLVFLQPKWIFKCHEVQKSVPFEKYLIVRTSE